MTNKIDEIDRAEALLADARRSAMTYPESTALATQAIGQLLLYFAKDQRDATQNLEKLMQAQLDAKLAQVNNYLSSVLGYSGGK